ncbi:MAG: hypothetical protein V4436_01900 [Patescibacteria group bacterium]
MSKDEKEERVIERILLLETVGVGCRPECVCRAYVASTLNDEQAASLEAEAKAVTFDHKEPIGEEGVLTLLGPTASADQVETLTRIARDKKLPGRHPEEKGGRLGAEIAIMQLRTIFARSNVGVILVTR